MTLKDKISNRQSGLIFYSFAPPKISTEEEKVVVIAQKQMERISRFDLDAVILYDIQDESPRTKEERTFTYIPTISPDQYSREHLSELRIPKIIYKSIANHTREMFSDWLLKNKDLEYAVFVGASSQEQVLETNFSLADAYELHRNEFNHLKLGGVTIPERHRRRGNEHLRLFQKQEKGCSFFVSQCVYNVSEAKNLLSDYYYDSMDKNYSTAPLVFTLSPCGSLKTLEFMQWLGIEVPKWLYNDLKHSKDILEASLATSLNIASELLEYSTKKGIPIGFNIESVSNKKEEIEAAIAMLNEVFKMTDALRKPLVRDTVVQ
jgi:5,10-methylenetetrahydrofolate reductase